MYEGRTAAQPGIVFGHENMGIVDEVAPGVTVRIISCLRWKQRDHSHDPDSS